ncbi:uridine kinase [Thorsellia anophelis]|uniref:Uridine kinase n=1 Tax=Thorsellia anophelis DSM 18579 TaxID=1123402 RepID=A0A1I0CHW9_9GAMM|nr:uridine kinase [Thorsellia anophelis]SET19003.1 uridine kinase [Thorsellia anophelis DSM 18579]
MPDTNTQSSNIPITNPCIIIGIAGASASGKTLLADTLYKELKADVGDNWIDIIPEDSYYKCQDHLTYEERIKTNYDHPNSMDHDLLISQLKALKTGHSVEIPLYDYVNHTRKKETRHFTSKRVIILEGILLLTDPRIREELNFSIFVDTPLDICLIRRMQRDMNERGRSMESVIAQYRATVRPMYLQFIDPSKQFADVIIPKGGKNRRAIEMLKAQIKTFF